MNDDLSNVHPYDDIINLPHHVSKSRPAMSRSNRAGQFSPFAALTGYEGAIKETARLTDKKVELDEAAKSVLDEKLRIIQEQLSSHPEIEITYFQPDEKKAGGVYVSTFGVVKKIDSYEKTIVMEDGTRVAIEEIINITGEAVKCIDD
ncbi:MAG TPA: YolD-like family protein [Clostridiales bacterium]|nr:YolD-like family protein [Clostridiales bacterium]